MSKPNVAKVFRLCVLAFLPLISVSSPCKAANDDLSKANPKFPWEERDLFKPKVLKKLDNKPFVLVKDGKSAVKICVMDKALKRQASYLQEMLSKSIGVKLPIVDGKVEKPAIILGDCELARTNGVDAGKLPIEGFEMKIMPDYVFIVGDKTRVTGAGLRHAGGTTYGIIDFLERFVGIRWFFPEELGLSVPKHQSLAIPSLFIADNPHFRNREIWPDVGNSWQGSGTRLSGIHGFLREGNSWPVKLRVHSPNWSKIEEYKKNCPEVYQLKGDGTRDYNMLCYGNPKTLEKYLENIELAYTEAKDRKKKIPPGGTGMVVGDNITVSPADAEISCYCDYCKKLMDKKGGQWGSASKILTSFVAKLSKELKKRYPDKTIVFLPYLNYTDAPQGYQFSGNVEAFICGMPGMALYAQPEVAASEQKNIDQWFKLTGRKVQNWQYSCWPADRTKAPFQYPHTIKKFYQRNRDKAIGTFINGVKDHWPRQSISLYCWLRCLWNPDYDVDAAVDMFCKRMFGPAAATMRKLVQLQMDRWEKVKWKKPLLSNKAVYDEAYPMDVVKQMEAMIAQAKKEASNDKLAATRVAYYCKSIEDFIKAAKTHATGGGLQPLISKKAGENPKIDGKLDDAVWQRAKANTFVRAYDKKQKKTTYATTVKSVWTPSGGVTFGFLMKEPTPQLLDIRNSGKDNPNMWWDDNVEILVDVTGKNEGEYYHFMINPKGAWFDAKMKDLSWDAKKVKYAAFVGKDFWSVEVYIPFDQFDKVVIPNQVQDPQWYGNFTRHRVADRGLKPVNKPLKGSQREYQRMNTTYAGPSNNLEDFAPIKFIE